MHASRPEGGQKRPAFEADRFREIVAVRIAPRAAHQPVEEKLCDVHEHEAGEDFVHPESVSEQGGDARPRHSSERAEQEHRGQHQEGVPTRRENGHRGAGDGPGRELTFRADVPEVGRGKHTASPTPISTSGVVFTTSSSSDHRLVSGSTK